MKNVYPPLHTLNGEVIKEVDSACEIPMYRPYHR